MCLDYIHILIVVPSIYWNMDGCSYDKSVWKLVSKATKVKKKYGQGIHNSVTISVCSYKLETITGLVTKAIFVYFFT